MEASNVLEGGVDGEMEEGRRPKRKDSKTSTSWPQSSRWRHISSTNVIPIEKNDQVA
jgi:hypothetical protein